LAELDAGYGNLKVLVADAVAGLKFKPEHGPRRLVVPGDRRHGRWVRQVTRIQVRRLAECGPVRCEEKKWLFFLDYLAILLLRYRYER